MPDSSALYFQGTAQQNGGLGTVFGDGLLYAVSLPLAILLFLPVQVWMTVTER
jgi:hypothetical protein